MQVVQQPKKQAAMTSDQGTTLRRVSTKPPRLKLPFDRDERSLSRTGTTSPKSPSPLASPELRRQASENRHKQRNTIDDAFAAHNRSQSLPPTPTSPSPARPQLARNPTSDSSLHEIMATVYSSQGIDRSVPDKPTKVARKCHAWWVKYTTQSAADFFCPDTRAWHEHQKTLPAAVRRA